MTLRATIGQLAMLAQMMDSYHNPNIKESRKANADGMKLIPKEKGPNPHLKHKRTKNKMQYSKRK